MVIPYLQVMLFDSIKPLFNNKVNIQIKIF